MNVIGDNAAGQVNYVDYFTNQLPKDLAAMAALRDELAKRQGALTAVEDANKLKAEAVALLAKAKAEAAELVTDANEANQKAKADAAEAKAKRAKDVAELADKDKALDAREKVVGQRERAVTAREEDVTKREAVVETAAAKYRADQDSLDERIKAFQAKVAALTA